MTDGERSYQTESKPSNLSNPSSRHLRTALALVIGAGLWWGLAPTLGWLGVPSGPPGTPEFIFFLVQRAVTALALIGLVLWWERRPLSSLGLRRPTLWDLAWAVVFFVGTILGGLAFVGGVGVLAYRHVLRRRTGAVGRWSVRDLLWVAAGTAFGVLLALLLPDPPDASDQASDIAGMALGMKVALLLIVVTAEELFFRGFVIERVTLLTGRLWLGGLVSWGLFVLSHVAGQGLDFALLGTGMFTAAFTILYLWRRNLYACMLLHALANAGLLFIS